MKVSKANHFLTEKKSRTSKLIVFIGLSFVDLEENCRNIFSIKKIVLTKSANSLKITLKLYHRKQ